MEKKKNPPQNPNPTTTENIGTEKQVDKEKGSLAQLLPEQKAMGTYCYY